MNELLLRRRVASAKPYDAEIEYLESSGTQYIATGILTGDKTVVTVDGQVVTIVAQARIIGTSLNSFEYYINAQNIWSVWSNNKAYSGGNSRRANTNRNTFVFDNVLNRAYINNSYWEIEHNSATYQGEEIVIFSRLNGYRAITGKLYSAQITENGVFKRDYIPVRMGQVGYMYDKVSGQLFGNAGTGDFILGPDV